MKKALNAATAVAAALVAAPAMAQDISWYGSAGYQVLDDDTFNFGAIDLRVGARSQHVGLELDAAFGVAGDEVLGVDVDLNHTVGLYLVGFLPVSDQFELIGRVGVANTELEVLGVSADDDSINYGIGAQWSWNENNAIRGDYTFMDFDNGGDANQWTLSYVRKF